MLALGATSKKKKVSASGVFAKITVTDVPTGQNVSQFGGVETYLSYITGHGPCLVVRGSRHKAGDGSFFPLRSLQKIFSTTVDEGKLTVLIPFQQRQCMIYIFCKDPEEIPNLQLMAKMMEDRRRWSDMEINVGRMPTGSAATAGKRGRRPNATTGAKDDGEAGVLITNKEARDAILFQPQAEEEEEFV